MIPMVHDFSMTVYCMDQVIDPIGPQWPIGSHRCLPFLAHAKPVVFSINLVYRGLITLISHFQQDNHIRS